MADGRATLRSRGQKVAEPGPAPATSELDPTDRRILKALQNEGRLTNLELSERVGLSPSPCLRRVKRLEAEGVLARYVALIDPVRVGLEVTVFTRVSLERQHDAVLTGFEQAVTAWPEVMECYLMSGNTDYQLRVVVPSLSAYEAFLRNRLTKVAGIANIQSSFALRPVVYRTELPIP
jgi:Lrp/AsnC family transcriptional regulator, leucine-responsive regulatory protein